MIMNMRKSRVIGMFLFAAGLLLPPGLLSQEGEEDALSAGAAPEFVRRPQRGEAPRYPRDTVIGELGRGTAPEAAWRYAQDFLSALMQGNQEAPVLAADSALTERLLKELSVIEPEKYRLGSGRTETDGTVSFLVRFLGREQGMFGEVYLRREDAGGQEEAGAAEAVTAEADTVEAVTAEAVAVEEGWRLDDLALEEAQDLAGERDGYRYDFSPYERFY
jgi:hypothetical protein